MGNSEIKDVQKENIIPQNKILFLGTGDSGKTSLIKQIRILTKEEITEEDLEITKEVIFENIINSMILLCEFAEKNGYDIEEKNYKVN